MNTSAYIKRLKSLIKTVRRRNPFKIERESTGVQIKTEDTSFDPTKHEHTGRTYLVTIVGMDTETKEVEEHRDDLLLSVDDKHIAITSKPIVIEGNRFYFTKPNFVGTMALNKDTLLSGDVYQPSKKSFRRKISKDIDLEKIDVDVEKKAVEENEDYYIIQNDDMGDVASLHGSKATLKEMNKAKRLRKLLKPSKADRSKLIMALVAGVSVGFVLYPRVMGQ